MSTTEIVKSSVTCSNLTVLHTVTSCHHVPKEKQPCLEVLYEQCFSLSFSVIAVINPKVANAGT